MTNVYRELPSVDRLLDDQRIAPLLDRHGREAITALVRDALESARAEIARTGEAPATPIAERVLVAAEALAPSLRPVVNATGVIIHTNLGRAPLSASAISAMAAAGAGYSNLEYDIEQGRRGSRFTHLEGALRRVTGGEAGIAVNNNASALLLALAALCAGGEVIISRGQLVEIGGGFRIPDVMRQSGATLVEVGTTNRTRLADYEAAITERTAAILRVHASNFRVVGFTESARLDDLVELAHANGVLAIDDLGSGALLDTARYGLGDEPTVQQSVATGVDAALFSGDKLLGGPQAGIAVGRIEPVSRMRRHPLARALRMDKATIAGLAATLAHYERGDAIEAIPVWRMIAADINELRPRAERWVEAWNEAAGGGATSASARSTVGGGSLPGEDLPTLVCAVAPPGGADALAAALRAADPPIIGRIQEGRVLLDPRTVDPADDAHVATTLRRLA
jgi:L-seryl-tRNA(Ser) seleniumtransferase